MKFRRSPGFPSPLPSLTQGLLVSTGRRRQPDSAVGAECGATEPICTSRTFSPSAASPLPLVKSRQLQAAHLELEPMMALVPKLVLWQRTPARSETIRFTFSTAYGARYEAST